MFFGTSYAQMDVYKPKKVLIEKRYYENGQQEHRSKTKRKGLGKSNTISGKQVIKLTEYYHNGKKELKEKKKIPRVKDRTHLSDERHILEQKKVKRKYKMWDEEGNKLEKGKYSYRGKKRIVKYRHRGYKKIIVTFDSDKNMDMVKKVKPIYK